MKRINITIEGLSPLIMNRFTEEAATASSNGTRAATVGDRGTPEEICEKLLYTDLDGTIGIPQPNLLRCLVDGGSFHKAGKSKITTQKGSLLYGCLDIEGTMLPLEHVQKWRVDTRPVRIPATGGRILRHRPVFDDWKLDFVAQLDTDIVTVNLLRAIVDDAGKRIGLGDFRPSTKGPFGRFNVTHWAVEDEKPALKKVA